MQLDEPPTTDDLLCKFLERYAASKGESNDILQEVRVLAGCPSDSSVFPGAQPVSLDRKNISFICSDPYVACEKTDGERFLLFAKSWRVSDAQGGEGRVSESRLFLINRKLEVFKFFSHLPRRYSLDFPHSNTLLDGELVRDFITSDNGDTTYQAWSYLAYDAICINDDPLIRVLNLMHRLASIVRDVIEPLTDYLKLPKGEGKNLPPFGIFMKDFFEIWDVEHIAKFSSKLFHKSDGIIFTPVFQPYSIGTCRTLLKWKPPHLNTVDFVCDVVFDMNGYPIGVRLMCGYKGITGFLGHWLAPFGDQYYKIVSEGLGHTNNFKIIECSWACDLPVMTGVPWGYYDISSTQTQLRPIEEGVIEGEYRWFVGGWVAERIRTDKKSPNDYVVVNNVVQSIEDGIVLDELITTFNECRKSGKQSISSHEEEAKISSTSS